MINTNTKKIIYSLIIALMIEIFICNAQELCTLFVSNKNVEVDYVLTKEKDSDEQTDKIQVGSTNIKIEDIDYEVCNVRIYYKDNYGTRVVYYPYMKAYGNEETELSFESKEIKALKDNTYINMRTEADAKEIRIEVYTVAQNLEIEKIVLNSTKLNINIFRIMIFFIISIIALQIKNGEIYKLTYNKNSKKQKCAYYMVALIIIMLLLGYYKGEFFNQSASIFTKQTNSEIMLMQTESFIEGQVSLIEKPSSDLLKLSNPYDKSQRMSISYIWDASLYNGNYYQYFTVLPNILIELPIRMLTGYYITTAAVNIGFLIIAILLLAKLMKKLIDRYIENISLFHLIIAQITVIIASNIILLSRGMMYEISELSGIINLMLSILIIFSIEKDKKIKNFKLILCGLTTAFLVISKPTYIFWYILIIPMLLKTLYDKNNKEINKNLIIKVILYGIPIGIVALLQMGYNYVRYDSIFEFGAKYQLTIYDMNVLMNVSIPKLIKGISIYLFKFPTIDMTKFPFISIIDTQTVTTTMGAITFEYCNLGLLVVPIYWALFLKNTIMKNESEKEKKLKMFVNITIVISIMIMLFNIIFAGMCEQYAIQYKVILAIMSILILLKGTTKKKIPNGIFIAIVVISILITLPIALNTLDSLLENSSNSVVVFLENMFEFWK